MGHISKETGHNRQCSIFVFVFVLFILLLEKQFQGREIREETMTMLQDLEQLGDWVRNRL